MLYLKNTYEEEIVEIPSQLQESFSLSDEYETSTYLDSLCDVFILYDKKQNKHFNLVAYDEINKRCYFANNTTKILEKDDIVYGYIIIDRIVGPQIKLVAKQEYDDESLRLI